MPVSVKSDSANSMALDLESKRHFPGAEGLENIRIGGRRTECACYFFVKTSGIDRWVRGRFKDLLCSRKVQSQPPSAQCHTINQYHTTKNRR